MPEEVKVFHDVLNPPLGWKRNRSKEKPRVDTRKGDRHAPITDDPHATRYSNGLFVMLDGEGVTHYDGAPQSYVAMGSSKGDEISGWSLSTDQCLNFLIDVKQRHGPSIYVAFAFKYDVSMMLRDLAPAQIKRIMQCKMTRWKQYRIEYIPNKKLFLHDTERNISITVFDIFTFFGKSLMSACKEYLGEDELFEQVAAGKDARNVFTYAELDTFILPYMRVELLLAAKLADKLRDAFVAADIVPSQWSGPGSVASTVLKKYGLKKVLTVPPEGVLDAAQYAYAGGHFEQYYCGYYPDKVYSYDIRSAYPYAATFLPNLSRGEWVYHGKDYLPRSGFSLIHVRFLADIGSPTFMTEAYPIPYRSKGHCIYYPPAVDTWVWTPEIKSLIRYCHKNNVGFDILESWEFLEEDVNDKPFSFVHEMYESRAANKAAGNPAQYAQKLSLNSIYGKLAQQKGKHIKDKPPPFHQLEYAGYITSMCRHMVWEAMSQNVDSIISVNTDGIYCTAPLDLEIGTALGQWEAEEYDGILSVQCGMYFLRKGDDWSVSRTRGIPARSFSPQLALDTYQTLSPIQTETTRFYGGSYAGTPHYNRWETDTPTYEWGGNDGKRVHKKEVCQGCINGTHWHRTATNRAGIFGGKSHKHILPWRDGVRSPFVQVDEFEDIYHARYNM